MEAVVQIFISARARKKAEEKKRNKSNNSQRFVHGNSASSVFHHLPIPVPPPSREFHKLIGAIHRPAVTPSE